MAGGKWTSQNKVLPGTYINFKSEDLVLSTGRTGIVTIPLDLNWGQENTVVEIANDTDTLPIFGDLLENIVPLREALKRATKVLAYRLNANTGVKATVTTGNLVATAKWTGTRGNDLKVVILTEGGGTFTVDTYLGTTKVDSQTGLATADVVVDNDYIVFTGTGVLAATAGATLSTGTTEAVVAGDHSNYRTAIEPYIWNTMALYDVTDAGIKASYLTFIQELRDNQGNYVQCVMENYNTADYEGIISVKNGVVLADGTTLSAQKAVAWVAGARSASGSNKSLTYDVYDDAVEVDTKYTFAQLKAAIEAGDFVFTSKDNKARVESDINTLTTYTDDKNAIFSKNRSLAALDGFGNDVVKIGEDIIIGKVDNTADGREVYRTQIIKYMDDKVADGTFRNFDAGADLVVSAGDQNDGIKVDAMLQPSDSIEKIYVTAYVS